MTSLAVSTVDLARIQFATTSLYHFLFVPLTLGLAPLIAVMQTLWHRSGNEAWLRLTRFFGTLLLINFAIGVATGLVQEFQFGMNWSVYSTFVGDVFGAPLAIEGLAAFMLESTFLGLWIFGWNKLGPRLHLATVWLFALGSWLSAFFIIAANSWMQRPVGSEVVDGRAELTSIWELLSNRFAIWAFLHVILVGLTTAAAVILGVACWHFLRGRNVEVFRHAAKLALIVLVPVSAVNLALGSHLGVVVTDYQPMKIAATEALWDTEQPAAFSLFQIGGFSEDDQTPSFDIEIPQPALVARHRLARRRGAGHERDPVAVRAAVRPRELHPAGRGPPTGACGSWRTWERSSSWSPRSARSSCAEAGSSGRAGSSGSRVVSIAFPYLAALAGWVLSEVGRQPWIVQGLLKTADANSPSVGTSTIALSLGTFAVLYLLLGVVDFVLMRHYATLDPPPMDGDGDEAAPAVGY